MSAEFSPRQLICFGEFRADLQLGRLFKRGIKLKLREQSFQVLATLLDYPGQIVTREELRRRLWPDGVFVDFDKSVNTADGRLREALGDSAEHPRFIETLPKRGYRMERMTPEATEGAKQHFKEAIKLDPEFALAYVALADLYSQVGYLGYVRPRDAYSIGFPCALRAVEIDGTLAEAHAVLAEYHKQLDCNWSAAEHEMARALELNRASPLVRMRHALVILMPHNRMGEAIAELECALKTDPLAGLTRTWLGIMWALARDYDRAIDEAKVLFELDPASCWPPFIRGISYRQKYFEESLRGH